MLKAAPSLGWHFFFSSSRRAKLRIRQRARAAALLLISPAAWEQGSGGGGVRLIKSGEVTREPGISVHGILRAFPHAGQGKEEGGLSPNIFSQKGESRANKYINVGYVGREGLLSSYWGFVEGRAAAGCPSTPAPLFWCHGLSLSSS